MGTFKSGWVASKRGMLRGSANYDSPVLLIVSTVAMKILYNNLDKYYCLFVFLIYQFLNINILIEIFYNVQLPENGLLIISDYKMYLKKSHLLLVEGT